MNIPFTFNPEFKKIVRHAQVLVDGEVHKLHQYFTIHPLKPKIIHVSNWILSEPESDNFTSSDEKYDFYKKIVDQIEDQDFSLEQYSSLSEIQALLNENFTPISKEKIDSSDLSELAKGIAWEILTELDFIVYYFTEYYSEYRSVIDRARSEQPKTYHISILHLLNSQKHISFSANTISEKGDFDKIQPSCFSSLNLDPEDVKNNPENYYEWYGEYQPKEVLTALRQASEYIIQNHPELFVLNENGCFNLV